MNSIGNVSVFSGFYSAEPLRKAYNSDISRVRKLQAKQSSHLAQPTRPERVQAQAAWVRSLAACYTKSWAYSVELHARQHNTPHLIHAICPFSGIAHSIDCSHMSIGTNLPKTLTVAVHPMLTATLSNSVEDSLTLQWQVLRTLYVLADKGILHMSAPFCLPRELKGSSLHRLTIAQEKLIELAYASTEQLSDVAHYNHSEDCTIDSLCVWAVTAHSKMQTGSTANTGIDDLDAMLSASERELAMQERIANMETKRARMAAQKKLTGINLRAAIATVCAVMEDLPHSGWTAAIHSTRLERITRQDNGLDLGWLDVLCDLIQDSYPDAHFVGNEQYSSMLLVMQKLDSLVLNTISTLAELGITQELGIEQITAKVASRYTVQATTASPDTLKNTTLDLAVHAISNSKTSLQTARTLAKQLVQVTKAQPTQPTTADTRTAAERIAAIRAARNA